MIHLAYLGLGGLGAVSGAYLGYSLGVALAYYAMRALAVHAQAQEHH